MAKHDGRDDKTGKFLKGNAGGGRPQGARSKLGEAFLEDMLKAWTESSTDAIKRVIAERPQDFLKVIASILPKEIAAEITQSYVVRMPQPVATVDEWLERYKPLPH